MADSTANSLKTKLEELDIFIRELGKQFRELTWDKELDTQLKQLDKRLKVLDS